MMYNKNTDYTAEEKIGVEDLKLFCSFLPKHFNNMYQTEYGTFCDEIGENITGGTNIIETKHRDRKALEFGHIYIEPKKYENLMLMYKKGITPYYVNAIGDDFYFWVLPQIPENRIKKYTNVKIKTREGDYKYEDRFGLPVSMAWIVCKDGSWIRPANKDLLEVRPPIHCDLNFGKPITNNILKNLPNIDE